MHLATAHRRATSFATDGHSSQHYFAVADGAAWTAVVATPDAPLLQVNGINTGRAIDGLTWLYFGHPLPL